MKVKKILARALIYAGRDDVAAALEADEVPEGEMSDAVKTALLCLNAVEDELARRYLPLKMSEKISSDDGTIPFSRFLLTPLRVISVANGQGEQEFRTDSGSLITCAGEVTVEYNYLPSPKTLSGDSSYDESRAGISLIAAGTASEYCLIGGDAGAAKVWEEKYRREIDASQRRRCTEYKLPPRRWV